MYSYRYTKYICIYLEIHTEIHIETHTFEVDEDGHKDERILHAQVKKVQAQIKV